MQRINLGSFSLKNKHIINKLQKIALMIIVLIGANFHLAYAQTSITCNFDRGRAGGSYSWSRLSSPDVLPLNNTCSGSIFLTPLHDDDTTELSAECPCIAIRRDPLFFFDNRVFKVRLLGYIDGSQKIFTEKTLPLSTAVTFCLREENFNLPNFWSITLGIRDPAQSLPAIFNTLLSR